LEVVRVAAEKGHLLFRRKQIARQPGFSGHAELLGKLENESVQKQSPRKYQTAIMTATEISGEPILANGSDARETIL